MDKRVFIYGCSFARWKWPTWSDIVQHSLHNYQPIINAQPGIGNTAIFCNMLKDDLYCNFNDDDIILVGWSGWAREDRMRDNGIWDMRGNLLSGDTYTKDYAKEYWSMTNDTMRNTTAIISANKMFNISHQHHIFDYEDVVENNCGWQQKLYGIMGIKTLESEYDFSKHWENMPEKELFPSYAPGEAFDGLSSDYHPDIMSHLEHATSVLEKIGLPIRRETVDFYTNEQERVINYLTTCEPRIAKEVKDGNWNTFKEVFRELFPECSLRVTECHTTTLNAKKKRDK